MKNIKLLSLIILFFSGFSAIKAQDNLFGPGMNDGGAEMKFETENHNFGKLKTGDKAEFDFKFKNTGKEPLIISSAEGSCDCTKATFPKTPIMPGQTSVIKVTYDTKKPGVISKKVVIKSNAWNAAVKEITINGDVL